MKSIPLVPKVTDRFALEDGEKCKRDAPWNEHKISNNLAYHYRKQLLQGQLRWIYSHIPLKTSVPQSNHLTTLLGNIFR